MKRWYVYRNGSNAANQSMTQTMRVATVKAETEEEACRLAAERVTVYNNQHLWAEDADERDAQDAQIDERVEVEE